MQTFRVKFTADPQLDSEGFAGSMLRSTTQGATQADRNIINELWPNESRHTPVGLNNPPARREVASVNLVVVTSWADMDQLELERAYSEWLAIGKDLRQYADRRAKDRRTPRR